MDKRILLKNLIEIIGDENNGIDVKYQQSDVEFNVDGYKYCIEIIQYPNKVTSGLFRLLNNPNKAVYKGDIKQFTIDRNEEEFGNPDIKVNYLKVLSIVVWTFIKYIKKYKPNMFVFDAFNEKRANLYTKVVNKFLKKELKEYTLYQEPHHGVIKFALIRNDNDGGNINESMIYFKELLCKEHEYVYPSKVKYIIDETKHISNLKFIEKIKTNIKNEKD